MSIEKLEAIKTGFVIFRQYAYKYEGIGIGNCSKSLNVFFTADLPEREVEELEELGWKKGDNAELLAACGPYWSYYRP